MGVFVMNDQPNEPQQELTEEEFLELVLAEQEKALAEARARRLEGSKPKKRRPGIRIAIYLMAAVLVFNTFAIIFQMYSIPAIEFLQVSTKLSAQDDIKTYKKSIVTISTGSSKGTGFAISADGYIVTNEHVIDDALQITVVFPDDGVLEAELIAAYPEVDLAILKVDGTDLPALQLADSLQFEKDEDVYFIGNPLYFTGIANEGTLLETTAADGIESDIMMMKAPVYKGNSGSPVINEHGEVIGVVFATGKREPYGKVGLFIPIDELHKRFSLEQ